MISIVTISYNSVNTISNTLKSIESQTMQDFEYIVVDGGSTDGTLEIINNCSRVDKLISEPDNGIYDAFNKGINNSTGDIIGFLNSDDVFYDQNSLKIITDSFNENIDCVFGDLVYKDSYGKIKRVWKGSPFKTGAFKRSWMPAHPTFYCKRDFYSKHELYNDSYIIAGDFELMLRFFEKYNIKSNYIPKTLVSMRTGGISNQSIRNKFRIVYEEFRAFKENNIELNKAMYLLSKISKIKELKV